MHENGILDSSEYIMKVINVSDLPGGFVRAHLITKQYGQYFEKPHFLEVSVWELSKQEGCLKT